MAGNSETELLEETEQTTESRRRRWVKRLGWFLASIIAAAFLAFAALNSPIGKRFIADQIASYAPASGLKIEIGRIEGDIYRDAILRDVRLSDTRGVFLTIPEIELDWRPLAWISRGLDVRKLVAKRGELMRTPELLPGDPDAPLLPDFDIRVDRLEIVDLTILTGVATERDEVLILLASVDIRDSFVKLDVKGSIGAEDWINLALLAEPDGERFDLDLDYRAPAGGAVAGLLGSEQGYTARIIGDGTWSSWLGNALVKRDGDRFAAFQLTNESGQYGLLGEVYLDEGQESLMGRALGLRTGISLTGTFLESRFDGSFNVLGSGLRLQADGGIDLANNLFDELAFSANLKDPDIFGGGVELRDASLVATIDGAFRDLELQHQLTASELAIGETLTTNLRQEGTGSYDGDALSIPLNLRVSKVDTGVEPISRELQRGTLSGELVYADGLIQAQSLKVNFRRIGARLALRFDPAQSAFEVSGPVNLQALPIEGVGALEATGDAEFSIRGSDRWTFKSRTQGRVTDLTNSSVQTMVGEAISFRGELSANADAPLLFEGFVLESPTINAAGQARLSENGFEVEAVGDHTRYGDFAVDLQSVEDGLAVTIGLDEPLPAAGIRDVRMHVSPSDEGYRIESDGQSTFGQFAGEFDLMLPGSAPARLEIDRLRVWETSIQGGITIESDGLEGALSLRGGGLDGSVLFTPSRAEQRLSVDVSAKNAVFGGASPISVGDADMKFSGAFGDGVNRFDAEMSGRAIRYGRLFLGRMAARADYDNGTGNVTASVVGRQGGRFNLQLDSNFTQSRIGAIARGSYSGTPISMERRAVLDLTEDGQWQLSPTRITLGNGKVVLSGDFGNSGYALDVRMVEAPLVLADLAQGELGLGGTVSGTANYSSRVGQLPVGEARLRFSSLVRSGLIVSSKPMDMDVVSSLRADQLQMQAVLRQDKSRVGWLDATVEDLPASGTPYERFTSGSLDASLRYEGASEALWRLAALDVFDLSGPVRITATARGTLAEPIVRGDLASSDLRVRSVLSGTDINAIDVRGDFQGSKLNLRRFSGTVAGGGSVTGSGVVDLANIERGRGPQLDIRAAASRARLVDARGLSATVTGPLRIVSSGVGGTIAGRLEVDNASWQLGTADEEIALPDITTREINLPSELERSTTRTSPWRYLIDARARNRIDVDGLGLDSEWRGNLVIRGTTADPRIGGEVNVIRGSYSFAGTRFDMTRGRITFDEAVPIDPRLDILAETRRNGINVNAAVRGNALSPEIVFTSDPALPEEEILARLLFGGAITELSATDALQLSAAVASLRGGGGLDPINQLRSQIGLDRLRIVGADPALSRGTGVALGENLGRRFYVEFITDGREYSATELEFRITSWLSLLASVSTVGRDSVLVEARRDY
ncbi:translocation/assembly module TamB domain-containing protein [Altererythrobacter sp.]|uniref:translocation/assembly module TamB domain-containing protein n=1 Tax=Altererythrobacter sp. TaxID=1872480 RepID=UPI001B16E3AA|nr:translocation/assembly module TamB domain-containing protein [Altererythrobacter sp.]MBO6944257.1 translocation/assembly module TamB domain-containing protein [Altererythrobacter sp.]